MTDKERQAERKRERKWDMYVKDRHSHIICEVPGRK